MKIGYGPLDVDLLDGNEVALAAVTLEALGYEFIFLTSATDALMAAGIMSGVTSDIRCLVGINREIDAVRDAEDLAVVDQLNNGRTGIVLGPKALVDGNSAEAMLRALRGAVVNGVRIFPKPAQMIIPVFAENPVTADLETLPVIEGLQDGALCMLGLGDLRDRGEQVLEYAPLALAISLPLGTSLEALPSAARVREEVYVSERAKRTERPIPDEGLGPSDLTSDFYGF